MQTTILNRTTNEIKVRQNLYTSSKNLVERIERNTKVNFVPNVVMPCR